MEKQVQLFPGVNVPYSVALWARFGGHNTTASPSEVPEGRKPVESMESLLEPLPDNVLELKYEGVVPEDFEVRKTGSNGGRSIGDIVDLWLKKTRASLKRHETFAPSKHEWRRDEGAADRGPKGFGYWDGGGWTLPGKDLPSKSNYLFHISSKELDQTEPQIKESNHWGTNRILEYFGFQEGAQRNAYLKGFNGDYMVGAGIVRAAFQLAKFYGLVDDVSMVPEEKKDVFISIASLVHLFGMKLSDRVIEAVGLKNLKRVVENYSPMRIFERCLDLVPTRDLQHIVSAMNSPEFLGKNGKSVMRELGYQVYRDTNGVPLLYHKPAMLGK